MLELENYKGAKDIGYSRFGGKKYPNCSALEERATQVFNILFVRSPLFWGNPSIVLFPETLPTEYHSKMRKQDEWQERYDRELTERFPPQYQVGYGASCKGAELYILARILGAISLEDPNIRNTLEKGEFRRKRVDTSGFNFELNSSIKSDYAKTFARKITKTPTRNSISRALDYLLVGLLAPYAKIVHKSEIKRVRNLGFDYLLRSRGIII